MAPLSGHFWTLNGYLRRSLRALPVPASRPWSTSFIDPDLGSIQLTGELSEPAGAEALVVVRVLEFVGIVFFVVGRAHLWLEVVHLEDFSDQACPMGPAGSGYG